MSGIEVREVNSQECCSDTNYIKTQKYAFWSYLRNLQIAYVCVSDVGRIKIAEIALPPTPGGPFRYSYLVIKQLRAEHRITKQEDLWLAILT